MTSVQLFPVWAIKQFFGDAWSMPTRGKETSSRPDEQVMEATSNLKRHLLIILGDLTFRAIEHASSALIFASTSNDQLALRAAST